MHEQDKNWPFVAGIDCAARTGAHRSRVRSGDRRGRGSETETATEAEEAAGIESPAAQLQQGLTDLLGSHVYLAGMRSSRP